MENLGAVKQKKLQVNAHDLCLSVIALARNEEEMIGGYLESVCRLTDEIILVVDDRTTDRTVEIAKKYTDKIFLHRFESFGKQLQFALKKAKREWVLWLDPDERITPRLEKEILRAIKESKFNGYHAFFQISFLGKNMRSFAKRFQGTTRLFKRDKAKLLPSPIHPRIIIEGEIGQLKNRILHYTHRTISQTLEKFNQYSTFEAQMLYKGGGKTNALFMILVPLRIFFRDYLLLKGYRNGLHGFIYAWLIAFYYLIKHIKLWELVHSGDRLTGDIK